MSHRKFEHPRHGSLGFLPRKRAARHRGKGIHSSFIWFPVYIDEICTIFYHLLANGLFVNKYCIEYDISIFKPNVYAVPFCKTICKDFKLLCFDRVCKDFKSLCFNS